MILDHELYVFIRGLPIFSGMIFEELEHLRPQVEVYHFSAGQKLEMEEGCSLVYSGEVQAVNGQVCGRGDMLYNPPGKGGSALTECHLVFFSAKGANTLLRKEPELVLPLVEKMKAVEREMMEDSA